jgi:hypothetical protein
MWTSVSPWSEAAAGTSNLKDELDVQLSLSRVVILVG